MLCSACIYFTQPLQSCCCLPACLLAVRMQFCRLGATRRTTHALACAHRNTRILTNVTRIIFINAVPCARLSRWWAQCKNGKACAELRCKRKASARMRNMCMCTAQSPTEALTNARLLPFHFAETTVAKQTAAAAAAAQGEQTHTRTLGSNGSRVNMRYIAESVCVPCVRSSVFVNM